MERWIFIGLAALIAVVLLFGNQFLQTGNGFATAAIIVALGIVGVALVRRVR